MDPGNCTLGYSNENLLRCWLLGAGRLILLALRASGCAMRMGRTQCTLLLGMIAEYCHMSMQQRFIDG